jgi:peptide/nickel transport system permease protein
MTRYIVVRLFHSALTLLGASVLIFVLLRVIPGDPAAMLLPEGASQSAIDNLSRELGLHEPMYVQYAIFLRSAVTLDFGQSFQYRDPVLSVVAERIPATIVLTSARLIPGLLALPDDPQWIAATG